MARQDKRRGGEPCARDARGLVTRLRKWASGFERMYGTKCPKSAARNRKHAAQLRANIRWVLAARRAVERMEK